MVTKPDIETRKRLLKRGVADIIVEEELVKLLDSGRRLRLKQGFDPSCPDIHLGHVVGLRKLRQFQELGHEVILIVGDWTAQIGDPSGESKTRPMLSAEEVRANAETYMKQFFKVIDREKTKVVWQSEWFEKFNLSDVIGLASRFTVAQMLQRDDFSKRYSSGQPIAITEFLYPLLQAYDSVVIEADVEFGGTDQMFNCLVGRELQESKGLPPQQVLLVPLLVGTDGSMKMSKSLDNYIAIDDPPNDMYGKVLSIPDHLIMDYFELLTDVSDEELTIFCGALENDSVNPMILKKRLARELVSQFHSHQAAQTAEQQFEKVVQQRETPEDIEEWPISFEELKLRSLYESSDAKTIDDLQAIGESIMAHIGEKKTGEEYVSVTVPFLLTEARLVLSRSEAKRLLSQGAVEVDGVKITDDMVRIKDGSIIKVGKRRFKKIVNSDEQSPRSGESAPKVEEKREKTPKKAETIDSDDAPAAEGQRRDIAKWLVDNRIVRSANEVKRLIAQGTVQIIRENGSRQVLTDSEVTVQPGDVVKFGNRRFAKIVDSDAGAAQEAATEPVVKKQKGGARQDVSEFRISFDELQDEAMLAAARESRAGDLTSLKDSIAAEGDYLERRRLAPESVVVTVNFILFKTGLVLTPREVKRLLSQGAIQIDGEVLVQDTATIEDNSVLTVSGRGSVRIVNSDKRI
jgi:tyrosyl-tRNA synthetase